METSLGKSGAHFGVMLLLRKCAGDQPGPTVSRHVILELRDACGQDPMWVLVFYLMYIPTYVLYAIDNINTGRQSRLQYCKENSRTSVVRRSISWEFDLSI